MNTAPIYENQFISSFIYSMGIIAGKRGLPVSDSINLFQQTPNDKTIGDLFAKWQGRNFIIEFKRTIDGLKSESSKPFKQNLLSKLKNKDYIEFKNVSELCHFVSFGSECNDCDLKLSFMPYTRINEILETKVLILDDMCTFLEKVLNGKLGVEHEKITWYFQRLHEMNSKSGSTPISGIIVNINKNGNPSFLRFDNLLFLENRLGTKAEFDQKEEKRLEKVRYIDLSR